MNGTGQAVGMKQTKGQSNLMELETIQNEKVCLMQLGDECRIRPQLKAGAGAWAEQRVWKIIIADDDQEVHGMTRMVLSDYEFEGRSLEFLSAYSGEETLELMRRHPDTAVILLDVVMEADDSGLRVVQLIRGALANPFVRIILRTGQPGKAPETEVIARYDINDYKEKTELTAQKLYSTITSSLRTFRDMKIIDQNRRGLEKIIEASANLLEAPSLKKFAQGVLMQLVSILQLDEHSALFLGSGFTASKADCSEFVIIAGTGKYEDCVGHPVQNAVSEDVMTYLSTTIKDNAIRFQGDMFAGHFGTREGSHHLLYLKGCRNLTQMDKSLVRIFSVNVAAAFENLALNREIIETQKEVIFTLGEVIESRSRETGNHVRRVAQSSRLLALKAGLSAKDADLLQLVSPMHDVGKVGIPDAVLLKTSRLAPEEFEIMKSHTEIGYHILNSSNRDILTAAVYAARQHHERWDGRGYPLGLKGEQIHIFGRITAVADVFDALLHKRVYKPAWPAERVLAYFKENRGRRFDPQLVDILLKHSAEFIALSDAHPDSTPIPTQQDPA
jgi:response regulator RpfG family c-di-GMP phosphodiesterase